MEDNPTKATVALIVVSRTTPILKLMVQNCSHSHSEKMKEEGQQRSDQQVSNPWDLLLIFMSPWAAISSQQLVISEFLVKHDLGA